MPDERVKGPAIEQDPVQADNAAVQVASASTVLLVPEAGAASASASSHWIAVVAPSLGAIRAWLDRQQAQVEIPHERMRDQVTRGRGLTIDMRTRIVKWDNRRVPVTELEYRLVETLAADWGRAVSFAELRASAWGEGPELKGDIFALRSAIQRLRKKLRQVGAPELLEAVRGFGFRLTGANDCGPR